MNTKFTSHWNMHLKLDFSQNPSLLYIISNTVKSVIYKHLIMQRTAVSKRRKSTSLCSCRSRPTFSELLGSQRESICRWTSHSSAPLDKHQSVRKHWAGSDTISAKNSTVYFLCWIRATLCVYRIIIYRCSLSRPSLL